MSIIRRAQAAAVAAEHLELPAPYRQTLDHLSGATTEELEAACVVVEFMEALRRMDCSDPDGR